jgi:hypothetical protein
MTRGPPGVECSAAEINNIDVLQMMRAAGWTKNYAHHMHNVRAVFTAARYEPERGEVAEGILQRGDIEAKQTDGAALCCAHRALGIGGVRQHRDQRTPKRSTKGRRGLLNRLNFEACASQMVRADGLRNGPPFASLPNGKRRLGSFNMSSLATP